jgi:hypothetical protein
MVEGARSAPERGISMTEWPRLTVSHGPVSPAAGCRNCRHPIRRVDFIGWVDMTPAVYGGLYDFCTAVHGAHVPEDPRA